MPVGIPGIGIGLNRGGLEAAVRALFSNGEQGAWFAPAELPTVWQDSAATTPGAAGQPAGRLTDKSGRDNHSIQATGASRPTLLDVSGRYGTDFDGAASSMGCASGGGGIAGFFYCAAIRVDGGAGALRCLFSDRSGNTGHEVRINASNLLEYSAGDGAARTFRAGAGLPVGETHMVTVWDDGTNMSVQVDHGAVSTVARPVVSAGTAGFTEGKDNAAASNYMNGVIFTRVYRQTAPNAAGILSVQRYVADSAGVVL